MRLLPADVYDTLELSALAYGGIGAFHTRDANGSPVCYVGHLQCAGVIDPWACPFMDYFGLGAIENDDAVTAIVGDVLVASGRTNHPRISFKRWCKELNVVRGA